MKNKIIGGIAILALVLAIVGLVGGKQSVSKLGGTSNYDELDASAIKVGGSNGSRLGIIQEGQAALIVSTGSVSASSTGVFDLAATGVVSGDNVVVQFSTSTAASPEWGATSPKWTIIGAKASTTAGFITVEVLNQTGGTAVVSASGIGSSTQYRFSHPLTSVPGL